LIEDGVWVAARPSIGYIFIALQNFLCCYANNRIASGIWYTYFCRVIDDAATCRAPENGAPMPRTATLGTAPSLTLFGRLMALIDRLLMASAAVAIRNDDPPYFGL
jgi:hypothetical protein